MVEFGIEFVPRDLYWKTTFYAIQAEKIGFDYLWITDHFNNRNVYVSLAIASAYTERIKFGPGVTNPYLVHPMVTAQAVATLNEIARASEMSIVIREADVPVNPTVQAAADMLGFDILTIANEGKFVAVVSLGYLAQRKPMSKYRPSGGAPARLAARTLPMLLLHEPPRMTFFSPCDGPLGLLAGAD